MSEIQSGDTIQIITPSSYGEVWLVDARDKSIQSNGIATFILINSRYSGHRMTYFLCKTEQAGLTAVEAEQGSVTLTSTAGGAIVVRKIKLMKSMS